jgi:hypothetical protein
VNRVKLSTFRVGTLRPTVSWTEAQHLEPLKIFNNKKGIPVAGRGGPQGCETLRLPHFLHNLLTEGGEVVSLTRRTPFTPQEDS